MKFKIIEYWEKVERDESAPFGSRVLKGQYEIRGAPYICESGWQRIADYRKRARRMHDFMGEIEKGKFQFDQGTYYGIHGYRIVEFI